MNLQEVPLQFVADHQDDQEICQNSKKHHSTRAMSSYGLTNWRSSSTSTASQTMTNGTVRYILLQPFLSHKYINLKGVLIKRRGLTTPERVNKVISGEKLGTDIPSRFLRRLQKTAGFGTTAVVGKVVIRQAFLTDACINSGAFSNHT